MHLYMYEFDLEVQDELAIMAIESRDLWTGAAPTPAQIKKIERAAEARVRMRRAAALTEFLADKILSEPVLAALVEQAIPTKTRYIGLTAQELTDITERHGIGADPDKWTDSDRLVIRLVL